MELLVRQAARRVWFGALPRPYRFEAPVEGEFALLLVAVDVDVTPDEQAELSEQFVRAGCRYAVCFGPDSSSWDDSIDMVGVLDEIDGREAPFVMTTWHDDEPLVETVEYLDTCTRYDDWVASELVVVVLGDDAQQLFVTRELLLAHFRPCE